MTESQSSESASESAALPAVEIGTAASKSGSSEAAKGASPTYEISSCWRSSGDYMHRGCMLSPERRT